MLKVIPGSSGLTALRRATGTGKSCGEQHFGFSEVLLSAFISAQAIDIQLLRMGNHEALSEDPVPFYGFVELWPTDFS